MFDPSHDARQSEIQKEHVLVAALSKNPCEGPTAKTEPKRCPPPALPQVLYRSPTSSRRSSHLAEGLEPQVMVAVGEGALRRCLVRAFIEDPGLVSTESFAGAFGSTGKRVGALQTLCWKSLSADVEFSSAFILLCRCVWAGPV